jgi:hypothetical protein
MRTTSARVVLGACLLAATAAAQAPASSFGFTPRLGGDLDRELATEPGRLAFDATRQDGQGPDYSLYGLFRQIHGEFMDNRERFTPQVDLRARILPNARVNHEPGSFDMLGYDFDAKLPVLVSTDAYLTFGAYYMGRRYVTSSAFGTAGNGAGNGMGDENLIATGGVLGLGAFLSENVLLEMETRPGVWSDMDDTLHHEDLDFPSSAQLTIRTLDNFFFKIGARYNQVYEDAPWLPILGFSWKLDSFRMDLLVPESVELSFWPSDSVGLLFGANVTGAEYHVHTEESLNQRDDLRVQEVITYLGLISRFSDNTALIAKAGLVVAGDYDLTTGAAGFDRIDGALDQTFFAEISFGWNF